MDTIKTLSTRFVDEYARERIFYGVNFGSKILPVSQVAANYADTMPYLLSYLKEHGLNTIRYILNWQYLEPEPDRYNKDVLNEIQDFLDLCEKNSIYVILDMHQDLFGAFINKTFNADDTGYGNGAPYWACVTNGKRYKRHLLLWAAGYFKDKAVQNAFDNFWNNTKVYGRGLQDRFCDLWRLLARKFGDHPAVLGFDILNEPFPGSDGEKIFNRLVKSAVITSIKSKNLNKKNLAQSLFTKNPVKNVLSQFSGEFINEITEPCTELVKKFDEERYFPFINKVSAAIREETQNGIIFRENCYYSNIGIPFSAPPAQVNNSREPNQAFAPHAYDFMVDTPLYKYADNGRINAIFSKRKAEQAFFDTPVLVGEWGGGRTDTEWLEHGEFILNLFDSFKWSSTYWSFGRELIDRPIMEMLCRPHPVAVCGEINQYYYDKNRQLFYLSFKQTDSFEVPTEIFCHKKPVQIKTNGRYKLEALSRYTYILKLFTDSGNNEITVAF